MIFEKFVLPFQLRFKDRRTAAIALSEILKSCIPLDDRKNSIVLGIPRGGAFTADVVCNKLSIPHYDILNAKKLTDPDNKEQAIGAIMEDGFYYIKDDLVSDFQISDKYIKEEIKFRMEQILINKLQYYQNLSIIPLMEKIRESEIIILIDDGIFSGATMIVAVKWLFESMKKNFNCHEKRLIIGTPVAPKNIVEDLKREFHVEVKTVFTPSNASYRSVEQYYKKFEDITNKQVAEIIKSKQR